MSTLRKWTLGWLRAAGKMQAATLDLTSRNLAIMADAAERLWAWPLPSEEEAAETSNKQAPPAADRRFEHPAWQQNPTFSLLRQSYVSAGQWLHDMAGAWEEVDPRIHRQAQFWAQQWVDAASPTNFAITNPEVMEETFRTGGANLAKGLQNWWADVQRGRVSMTPEDSFVVGKDLAITPGKVIYRNKLIELIQYLPTTPKVHATPILVIPPWINKYYIMDLRPKNSMFKYLIDQGFTLFTISWKNPDASVLDLAWADYMDLGPLAALKVVKQITGAERVNLVGYCLGGIILQTTLAYLAATQQETSVPNTATFFTTHQDFTDAGDIEVFLNGPGVTLVETIMKLSGGYLDGRNMAATFGMLRANDLLWNYWVNNYLLGKQPPAFDLLYWNSDGTRVPGKVHSFLLREFFLANKLKEPGGIKIKDAALDTRQITTPTYCVAGSTDHIVPWRGASLMRQLHGGSVRFVLAESGHIAGIINPPAANKRCYWVNERPDAQTLLPDAWLESADRKEGSWWVDWVPWLAAQSGDLVSPPPMGSAAYPPMAGAPGQYVLEK